MSPPTAPRIRVVGEALVDLVGDTSGRVFTAHPGGSPANVAVDLARLDIPVTLHGRIGPDAFGRLIRAHLAGNGVDLGGVVAAQEPSSLAVATISGDGEAAYDFWTTGTADWQWRDGDLPDHLPADTVALHTGSLASWLPPSATAVAALLARERIRGTATLSYDPNCRPDLMGDRAGALSLVERLVSLVDVVKVSQDDLAWLLPGQPLERIAQRWLALGPALVVVTLGGGGAYGLNRTGNVRVAALPVTIVDTIGAGDAFTAGLLAGLYRSGLLGPRGRDTIADLPAETLRDLLRNAATVAGLTCAQPGAAGPTTADIRTLRAEPQTK
ncbi:carbohydrate kinase family protein [Phytohabitans kaempferiae]|uniref:Carbohydrate kinase n=1 Tax=Phytohabitans kaempferiae TaxID=1620943 RepID=A0ABV6M9S6_9ACTN